MIFIRLDFIKGIFSERRVPVHCRLKYNLLFLLPVLVITVGHAQKLGKRTSFDIPLVKLRIVTDKHNPGMKQVQVSIDGNSEYALISGLNDIHIKPTRRGIERITYAESPAAAFALTDFEAQQFERVVKSLIETLEIFENDLEKKRWDRCLYLDSFFPRFLEGFHFLSCKVFNSPTALPQNAKVDDALFDISLHSKKSDQRIAGWLEKKDYVIKLRIVTKELIYQMKTWQKKELKNYKKKMNIEYYDNLKETYSLFIRMYFNLY